MHFLDASLNVFYDFSHPCSVVFLARGILTIFNKYHNSCRRFAKRQWEANQTKYTSCSKKLAALAVLTCLLTHVQLCFDPIFGEEILLSASKNVLETIYFYFLGTIIRYYLVFSFKKQNLYICIQLCIFIFENNLSFEPFAMVKYAKQNLVSLKLAVISLE